MMKLALFTDFDGTISKRDVGYSLFHHFSDGKNDLFLPDWKEGRMTTRECLLKEAELVTATKAELVDLKVDPSYESDFDWEEMAARTSRRIGDRRCVTILSVSADHITLRGHAGSDIVMTASD